MNTSTLTTHEVTKEVLTGLLASTTLGMWITEIVKDIDISNLIQWPVAILTMLLLFARVQAKFRKNKDMKQRAKLELNSLKIENDRKAVEVEILRRELDGFEANIKDNQARQEDEEPGK